MGRDRPEAIPLFHTPRSNRETTGHRKAGVARALGKPFIPWQRQLADVWGEIDPATGTYWYRTLVLIGLRQIGKTTFTVVEGTETGLFYPDSLTRYTAQTRGAGTARLEDEFHKMIRRSPLEMFLDRNYGKRTHKPGWDGSTAAESIRFTTGAKWEVEALKEESGHGPPLTKGLIDEAFAHQDGRVEQAMRPAMQTIPHAQLLILSAAGNARSTYLASKREQEETRFKSLVEAYGPDGPTRSRTCFVQYALPADMDPDDPASWWYCHPGLGWLTTEETLAADREAAESDPWEFWRPYVGWWRPTGADDWVIPQASVKACIEDDEEAPDWTGTPIWSIDVSPDRGVTTIALAGTTPGARCWVEIAAQDSGTEWAVGALVRLRAQLGGNVVVIDGAGPAGSLEKDLDQEGFEVRRMAYRDKVDGCSGLYDDFAQGRLRFGGDAELIAAIRAAEKQKAIDAWIWTRGKSRGDITALYAVTLARQELVMNAPPDYDIEDSVL